MTSKRPEDITAFSIAYKLEDVFAASGGCTAGVIALASFLTYIQSPTLGSGYLAHTDYKSSP